MMRNIWLFLVLVGFIISPLMGQDVKKEGEPQKAEFPKNGVVTADKVNLRCGAGENFRALTTLKKNDKLVVVKVEGEWCAVVPPSGLGIFFLIHKRYV
ncbi:MAG: SH3 domain-containing protein, partial [Planctomycetota bacterium]|nr:SH3 domain-containing protein [Planctomycetota bacterium]